MFLDIFSSGNINGFHSFLASGLQMHVRCDNQYKTGAEGGTIWEQPMLIERMDIGVLSLKPECEIRGYRVYLLIVKNLYLEFCLNSATVY